MPCTPRPTLITWIKEYTNEEMDLNKWIITFHSWPIKCVGFISFLKQNRAVKLLPVKPDWIVFLLACLPPWAANFHHCLWTQGPMQFNACGRWSRQEGLSSASAQSDPASGLIISPLDCSDTGLLSHCVLHCICLHALVLAFIISDLCYRSSLWTDRQGGFRVRCI